eukprot:c21701_g2_i4.p1 GENE.c21701_g2_i4~~c21701_g2_i4.p1  ORF type:complete len:757 (+),score=325.34 c21701_g2_i4:849-3119(+)
MIHEKLRDARMDSREAERNQKKAEMVKSLQRLFPGVYGSVFELCKPVQKKYNVAVTVALGKEIDSIIVDSNETCRNCVEYLRDQRAGIATFIPLNSIKAPLIDDSLRTLGGTSKLVLDVVQFENKYEKAMRYVFGETLLFDGIDEARKVCITQSRRYRGVTLDGTKIDKSGVMTGGISGVEQRALRWDQSEIDKLKKDRERYERELQSISVQRLNEKIAAVKTEIQGLERKIEFLNTDLNEQDARFNIYQSKKTQAAQQLKDITPRMKTLEQALASRENRISTLKESIAKAEDTIFSEFAKSIGVANVREYETKILTKRTQQAEELARYTTQQSKLQSKLDYEKSKDRPDTLKKIKAEQKEITQKLQKVKDDIEKKAQAVETAEEEYNQKEKSYENITSEQKQKESLLKEFKKKMEENTNLIQSIQKKISDTEIVLERNRANRVSTIQNCKNQDITIPLLDVSEGFDGAPVPKKRKKRPIEGEEHISTSESFSFSESQPSQSDLSQQSDRNVQIDFSLIKADHRDDHEMKKARELYENDIKKLVEDLEKMTPNFKAFEKLNDIEARLKGASEEFETIRLKLEESSQKFNKVKEQRKKLFFRAVKHISKQVGQIYKELTITTDMTTWGKASLSLEDSDEPYNGGVGYNATPREKGFRSMEQLSGGEKTVAAIALLFAIHSYHPSPFFILDEVDAALDQQNVQKVSSYIASRSNELQCIVISLKDSFYDKAQSLVGIYRDQQNNCSKTLSLDLTDYDQ